MTPNRAVMRFVWIGVIFLAFIGIAMAARRSVVLLKPGALSARNNPAAEFDGAFADRRTLTFAHILPAVLFMMLGPLQFARGLRAKYPRLHRWSGRVFLTASLVVGVTGLALAFGKTIGGGDERAAITLFGSFFLIALSKGLWHAVRGEFAQHREWMIRAYAVALGVATTRPIVGMFFAFRRLTPHEFFGIAFWLGFTITFLAAEAWIDHTRPRAVHGAESFSGQSPVA